jgi:hypothetical protein
MHLSTGIDGQRSVWPEQAVSRDSNGIFRDFKGRRVAGVGMDSATRQAHLVAKSTKVVDNESEKAADAQAMKVIKSLLPRLLKMLRAETVEAEGTDDTESENADLFGGENPEAADEAPIHARATNWYRKAREYWQGVSTKNRQQSQFAGGTGRYPSATAVAPKTADAIAANAKAARQTSAFTRF